MADQNDNPDISALTSTLTAPSVESAPFTPPRPKPSPALVQAAAEPAAQATARDRAGEASNAPERVEGLSIGPIESSADEDHRTNLARFRFAMGGGLVVCILFGAVDWLVVAHIHPAAFIPFLTLRLGIIAAPAISLIATRRLPNMSRRTLKAFDLVTFTSVAGMISLMCVWFRGIVSPYYAGVIVVVVCRGAAMPTNWRSGVLYFGLPAATFPGIMLTLAPFDQQIARQLQNPPQLALFALNTIFIASSLLLVILGSHAVWALRRQLYATRSLGRYRLQSRLGAGGMGEVWRAHHPGIKRDVAIKILRPDRSNQEMGIARFEREVAATVRLTHPHTVRVFDHGVTHDGLWYYAMELLDGRDLRTLVKQEGPLPPQRVAYLAGQAARALAEAHAIGIVHRDIKPANLFLTTAGGEDDFLKVLDFGIAKFSEGANDPTLTRSGWLGGTPDYMSPELVLGHPVDARTDIYSLGAVMYFLLTGQPPFVGKSSAEVMNAQVNKPLRYPSHLLGSPVPTELEEIVVRCLAKDREERFPDAKSLAVALTAFANMPRSYSPAS